MARKLRIEFEGAIYHVLNRGNYRRDLFLSSGEAQAFVLVLEEAAKTFGWSARQSKGANPKGSGAPIQRGQADFC